MRRGHDSSASGQVVVDHDERTPAADHRVLVLWSADASSIVHFYLKLITRRHRFFSLQRQKFCASPPGSMWKRPRIPHVLQSHNWDCGLACVEMAMRALGVAPHDCSLRTLRTRVPSTSVWTVDLVHIICSFGIKFRFLTTTIGVNPAYKDEVCDSGLGDLPKTRT